MELLESWKTKEGEILKKWDDYGFLQGIDDGEKLQLAIQYEKMATYIISLPNNNDTFETIAFPIVRRTFRDIKDIDVVDMHTEYNLFFRHLDLTPIPRVDVEAEATAFFCEEYTKNNHNGVIKGRQFFIGKNFNFKSKMLGFFNVFNNYGIYKKRYERI